MQILTRRALMRMANIKHRLYNPKQKPNRALNYNYLLREII